MTFLILGVLAAVVATPLVIRGRRGSKKKDEDPNNIYPVW